LNDCDEDFGQSLLFLSTLKEIKFSRIIKFQNPQNRTILLKIYLESLTETIKDKRNLVQRILKANSEFPANTIWEKREWQNGSGVFYFYNKFDKTISWSPPSKPQPYVQETYPLTVVIEKPPNFQSSFLWYVTCHIGAPIPHSKVKLMGIPNASVAVLMCQDEDETSKIKNQSEISPKTPFCPVHSYSIDEVRYPRE